MTPKQKAIELTHKFCSHVEGYFGSKKNMIAAKKAALVAVDEIISVLNPENWGIEMNIVIDEIHYWNKVKEEINNIL
jgi:hypothetical protein